MCSIKTSELEKLLIKIARKYVTSEEANYFSKQVISEHVKKFPRLDPLEETLIDLKRWEKHSKNKIEIAKEKSGLLLLNFNSLPPILKIKYIHDEVEKRTKKNGIATIGINNSGGIHTLSVWTEALAERNILAICMYNGGANGVVPYGGTRGIMGTNPISYAIPTNGNPILTDFATTEIPYFEFRRAQLAGKELPPRCAVDKNGIETNDPNKATMDKDNAVVNMLPMGGGIKGYLMVLLVEIMTGSLVRARLSNFMTNDEMPEQHGGIIIGIDIASFTDVKKFKNEVTKLCNDLRGQKSKKGIDKVLVPGDKSYGKVEKMKESGKVKIKKEVIDSLRDLAK